MRSKRMVAHVLVATLVFQSIFGNVTVNAAELNENSETAEYIVQVKNEEALAEVLEEKEADIVADSGAEELKEQQMTVLELTENEAEELLKEKDVILVEENVILEASTSGTTEENVVDDTGDVVTTESKEEVLETEVSAENQLDETTSTTKQSQNDIIAEDANAQENVAGKNPSEVVHVENEKKSRKKDSKNISFASKEYQLKMSQKETREKEEKTVEAEDQWNIDIINANEKEYEQGTDKIKVAVLDTGISATEDINVAGRVNFIEGEEEVNPLYEDISGHGTSVASVIAAKENEKGITGINPNVELYSIKVLDDNKKASLSNVIKGIYWCIDNDIDIINMSFGTNVESEILEQVIKKADDSGILMIAAAGNRGAGEGESTVEYPAAYEEVIAVGSINPNGKVSDMSSLGAEIDLMAPGELVPATGYFDEVIETEGTSMAAAHVTGVASVLWAKDRDKSGEFIKALLSASAKSMSDDGTRGNGLVDLGYALSVYEEFAYNYVEGVGEENYGIQENCISIGTYTDEEVEASWGYSKHSYAVGLYDDTSDYVVSIIKIGSKIPDTASYLKYSTGNTDSFHGHYNYVANYMYVMRMARICWDKGMDAALRDAEYPCSGAGKTQIYNGITELNKNWNQVLSGKTINNKNKARVLVGIAIHIAMDVYAHKAYLKDSTTGKWTVHISGKNQDDTSYVPSRWTCAKDIAYDIMDVWKYDLTPDAIEFYQPEHSYKKFRLFKLNTYVNRADSESYLCETTYYNRRTAD